MGSINGTNTLPSPSEPRTKLTHPLTRTLRVVSLYFELGQFGFQHRNQKYDLSHLVLNILVKRLL
jgi:hypothetical protein